MKGDESRTKQQFSLLSRMNRVHRRRNALRKAKVNFYRSDVPQFSPIYRDERIDGVPIVEPDISFHVSILPVATFFQFLALMPVCGVSQKDPKFLKFKWASLRVIYTLAYILWGVIVITCYFYFVLNEGISSKNFVFAVFFAYTVICVIVFLAIATNWPPLMAVWHEKEQRFLRYPYKPNGWNLSSKIRITAVLVVVLGNIEYFLYIGNSTFDHYKYATSVNETFDIGYFLKHLNHFIFSHIEFNLALGILVEIMNFLYNFGWNYMELFTMMISLGLMTRFGQINDRLDTMKGKIFPETVWIEVREDYVQVCELLERVDHELRFLILLSNINNLYVICVQLIKTFDSLPYTANYVYFWYSLIYFSGRAMGALYLAAKIHDASNYPLEVLKALPSEGWCIEVQRMIDQIRAQHMALSGCKFFFLTRNTILTMLTMIVTYVLVFLQFDTDHRLNKQFDTDHRLNK